MMDKKMTKAEYEAYREKENERKRRWRENQRKKTPSLPQRKKTPPLRDLDEVHRGIDALKVEHHVDTPATRYVEDDGPMPRTYSEAEVRSLLRDAMMQKTVEPEPAERRLTRAERKWERRKEQLRAELQKMEDADAPTHPISVEDAVELQQSQGHRVGKRKIRFARDRLEASPAPPSVRIAPPIPPGRDKVERRTGWRTRRAERKSKEVFTHLVPEALPPGSLDIVSEQVEKPQTSVHCPESIKEDGLKDVKKNPEQYIEINMVTKSRVVDTFYVRSDRKKFYYKDHDYNVDEEAIYLLPTKLGLFMPTSHYKEGVYQPRGFRQTNKGITGKALSLLYMEQLYTSLLYSEDLKYNLFIVILSIASLICYGVGCYFLFNNLWNPGATPDGGGGIPIIGLIPARFLW